jgi:hypothetical protein
LNQILQKEWKKSEENPMNQIVGSYNATQGELVELAEKQRAQIENIYEQKDKD